MALLRDIHRENIHLVQKQELTQVHLLENQMGRIMKILRDIHWDFILVQDMKEWEVIMTVAPPMASQVGMYIASLKGIEWEHHWEKNVDLHWDILLVQDLELWYVLLMVALPMVSQVGM